MASADYTHCDLCDAKAFYDAEICWAEVNTGEIAVLCRECAKTHTIRIELLTPEAIRARGDEQHPECSICRRRHGREVEHACE